MTSRDNDPEVRVAPDPIMLGNHLEIHSIVSQQCRLLLDSVCHLLSIASTELTGVTRRGGHKAACSEQVCDKHVDILIQVKFDEQAIHDPFTSGSIKSSVMRFRSMY